MKVNRLIFIIIFASSCALSIADIAFSIGLVKNNNVNSDFRKFGELEVQKLEAFEFLPLTTVEIICDCDDSCVSQPKIESQPQPIRGFW